jgi:hypothetical protein
LTGIALISLIQAECYTKRLLGQPSRAPLRPSTRLRRRVLGKPGNS